MNKHTDLLVKNLLIVHAEFEKPEKENVLIMVLVQVNLNIWYMWHNKLKC